MSKYVMSDIHGCYEDFLLMIEKINFNEKDTLYILGDIFDRGPEPLKILDYIVGNKNIHLLKGNHEKMYEEALETNNYELWYYNGGMVTHEKLLELGREKEIQIYNYIKKLPIISIVDKFILVHAGLFFTDNYENMDIDDFLTNQDVNYCLWTRENIGYELKYKDYNIICGHTPVQTIEKNYNRILHRNGTYYIDCGCCRGKEMHGQLACIRLDDLKEYYV